MQTVKSHPKQKASLKGDGTDMLIMQILKQILCSHWSHRAVQTPERMHCVGLGTLKNPEWMIWIIFISMVSNKGVRESYLWCSQCGFFHSENWHRAKLNLSGHVMYPRVGVNLRNARDQHLILHSDGSTCKDTVGVSGTLVCIWIDSWEPLQQTCIPLSPLGKPTNSTTPLIIGWPGSPGKPTSPWMP